jgi:hypothetical protein
MRKVLPVGAEYEYEFPPTMNSTQGGHVYRYKVVSHHLVSDYVGGPTRVAARIDVVDGWERRIRRAWTDGVDGFGRTIWRLDLDGDPASLTYENQLEKFGVPEDSVKVSKPSKVRF